MDELQRIKQRMDELTDTPEKRAKLEGELRRQLHEAQTATESLVSVDPDYNWSKEFTI